MLLFSSTTFTVDGITVFPDHADPNQFWYLPGPVGLETEADSTEPQFLMITYSPDVGGAGISGSGFLNVTTALKVSDETQSAIVGKIRTNFPDVAEPRLAPVPFDDGTVQIIALDAQGSGGTNGATPAAGQGQAVEKILGTSNPELFGNNDAVFGLTLTEEGATILEQAFKDGMTPVGAIYNMKFSGVLPALDVKITCDLKRAYDSFSVDAGVSAYFASAGIDATFEKLRQDGSIKIDVVNLGDDAATAAQETAALAFFKDQIMSTWFSPSLGPTTAAAADAASVALPPTTTTTTTSGSSSSSSSSASSAKNSMGGSGTKPATGSMGGPVKTAPANGSSSVGTAVANGVAAGVAGANGSSGQKAATPPQSGSSGSSTTTQQKPANSGAAGALGAVAGTAAAASKAASPFGLSLKLKFVQQDELKTVEYDYNQMNAVQRTYSPQGYFGLLLAGIDQSKHFLKVDGNDPFFNQFTVTVNPPKDYATIGLQTAHVAIDYGNAANPTDVKHGEYVFDPQHDTQQVWDVFQGFIQQTNFNYTSDYAFDPASGWQGEKLEYQQPTVTTENRLVTLDPSDFLGFLKIAIAPGKIDASIVDRIEVPISYTSASGWVASDTFVVKPGAAPQYFPLRLADKTARTYSYSTNTYLKDGSLISGAQRTSDASALVISDPFLGAINLLCQPSFDVNTIALAIVEIVYQDTVNSYTFQTSFEMQAGSAVMPLRIPIIDRTQTSFQYRITLLSKTNVKTQGQYVTASDPLVLVGP